jgi:putative peptidoglycan lipid II flippase
MTGAWSCDTIIPDMSRHKKLIKHTGIISFAILSSRILGFLRVILFAAQFGTSVDAQAFVVAFKLPNMLRDMIGEGATNSAIVPILTEYRHKNTEKEYWEAARVILNLMMLAVLLLAALGVIFAPLIIKVIAPGFIKDPAKFAETVHLTRIIFPYIIFLGIVAYSTGVLNSRNYFTAPAYAPVILNATMIMFLVAIVVFPELGIKTLAIGILVGGVFQTLLQVRPLVKRGFSFKGTFRIIHPVAGRVVKLLGPRMLGTAVYQLSVLIDTVIASFGWIVQSNAVSVLDYAHRLIHLPLAIFGIALATAALPKMSKEAALENFDELKKTIKFSLNTVFTIMMPATAGLMILSSPIVSILLQRGEFTANSTALTSNVLFFYTFGLCAYAGIKILVNAFYSMGDTKTPVKTASVCLVLNLILNLTLMYPLKVGGLALATSIAASVNFILLYFVLARRIGDFGTKTILCEFGKIFTAAGIMGVVAFLLKGYLIVPDKGTFIQLGGLIGTIGLSVLTYLVVGNLLKIEGLKKITGLLMIRISKR